MSNPEQQLRLRDREMVPLALVRAMFALMALSVAGVAYVQIAGVPNTGVLVEGPIAAERSVRLVPQGRHGDYAVVDPATGDIIARSSDPMAGFYGVMGKSIDRRRQVFDADPGAPVRVVRRENGQIAILDPETDWTVELIGYGQDNVAAFGRLVD